jgi:hypothetical protein
MAAEKASEVVIQVVSARLESLEDRFTTKFETALEKIQAVDKILDRNTTSLEEHLASHVRMDEAPRGCEPSIACAERLTKIEGSLGEYNRLLEVHVKRCDQNEAAIEQFKRFMYIMSGVVSLVTFTVPFLLFFLNKVIR